MNIFLRFAAYTNSLPNRIFTKAYDARVLFIVSGKGEIRFADRKESLFANSFAYYPSGVEYLPLPSKDNPPQFVTLNFDFDHSRKHINKVMPPVATNEFKTQLANNSHLNCGHALYETPFILHNLKELRDFFLEITKAFARGTEQSRETAQSLLQYILCYISEQEFQHSEDLYNQIVGYVSENLSNIESNEQIAKAINYHPNYINQYFKSKSGETLHKYILNQRLQRSVELLNCSNESISSIAYEVGFKNSDHFSKCFKKFYGITPSELRNKTKMI